MSTLPTIGIVGAGRMGANIALRLADVGYPVTAYYDIRPEAARVAAAATRGTAYTKLADVTANADVIITVVTDDAAMDRVFAENGDSLLEGAKGKIFVNCATVTPAIHIEVQRRAEARGAHSLEACMASSIPQARQGTLYLMVGGRRDVFDTIKPMLEKMSASLRYIGEAGRAAQVKALVNMVMNINTAGLAEGLGLGDALGLDLAMLREVFSQTGANSRVLETDGEDMQNREHDVYFSAEHAAKDSGIALSLAGDVDLALPLAQATFEQFERMKAMGLGQLDKSGVSELTFLARHGQHASKQPTNA
ncbi:MAG TPA: NAD(P)-dependent oxidoreductase [Candidatus Acidoferrum sp.]|nr:NAD(P)-dependent oxidoreductase [Candidatus Acidoferrum sp.]